MDGKTLRNLRIAQAYSQQALGDLLGIDRSFVAQIETEVRVLPKKLVDETERILAVGSPQSRREKFLYVLARLRASGGFVFPKELQAFRSRELADGAAAHLRRIGYEQTTVVPAWENGLAELAGFSGKSLPPEVRPMDEGLVRDLARGFRTTRKLD